MPNDKESRKLVSPVRWAVDGAILGIPMMGVLKVPGSQYFLPAYLYPVIKFTGNIPLKTALGMGALGGGVAGFMTASAINALYNGSTSRELNITHPIVYGGMIGGMGGFLAYSQKNVVKKLLSEHGFFSKTPELILKTSARSTLAGCMTGASLGIFAYVAYRYLHKNDDQLSIEETKSLKKN
jgi:hypothetical protein